MVCWSCSFLLRSQWACDDRLFEQRFLTHIYPLLCNPTICRCRFIAHTADLSALRARSSIRTILFTFMILRMLTASERLDIFQEILNVFYRSSSFALVEGNSNEIAILGVCQDRPPWNPGFARAAGEENVRATLEQSLRSDCAS